MRGPEAPLKWGVFLEEPSRRMTQGGGKLIKRPECPRVTTSGCVAALIPKGVRGGEKKIPGKVVMFQTRIEGGMTGRRTLKVWNAR